jgi:hypothetical protein
VKNHCLRLSGWGVVCCAILASTIRAAQPGADQLLPAETILMFTVKDVEQASTNFWKTSLGRLWVDDSMRGTREKFGARWTNEVSGALEKEFKIKLSDYTELARGQCTFGMTKPAEEGKSPGFLFLIDAKDRAEALKTNLTQLREKWGDRKPKPEKVRDVEFVSYEFTQAELQKFARIITGKGAEGAADPETEANKVTVFIGQSQSLLIVASGARDLEKVLSRQSGGGAAALGGQPTFQSNFNSLFRDAGIYGWLDFKPVFEQLMNPGGAVAAATQAKTKGMENLRLQKVLPALGLAELKSIALRVDTGPEGFDSTIFLTAPEADRHGLLKILAPPAKDASPPPFVPADAVKFQRIRIDFAQAWDTFEKALIKIDPSVAGVVQLLVNAAGKEKDPNFDFKKSFVETVGDDFITYEKAAKNGASASITLIGARNSEQLLSNIRAVMRLLPEPVGGAGMKEREFLGRKIYSVNMAPPGVSAQAGSEIQFVAAPGYVAMARDNAILEEYLRSAEALPKPLRDAPGFNEAAQKVGGMNSGWFSFENQAETMRTVIEDVKKNPDNPQDESSYSFPKVIGGRSSIAADWIDYSSLPAFDAIAKYFYYSLGSTAATPEGIAFKMAAPTPPALK